MKLQSLFAAILVVLFCTPMLASSTELSPADEAAAFKAAGFTLKGKQWRACDDNSASYTPGAIEQVRDLNGDGRPDALVTEGSTDCYGNTGVGYSLVSQQANGTWKLMTKGIGMVSFLTTKGVGGWPDIEVGGPGFCFPVLRWNGKEYVLHGHQYEGKPCQGS
jgi:hypothetical protein